MSAPMVYVLVLLGVGPTNGPVVGGMIWEGAFSSAEACRTALKAATTNAPGTSFECVPVAWRGPATLTENQKN
jgi:hypothetical protein